MAELLAVSQWERVVRCLLLRSWVERVALTPSTPQPNPQEGRDKDREEELAREPSPCASQPGQAEARDPCGRRYLRKGDAISHCKANCSLHTGSPPPRDRCHLHHPPGSPGCLPRLPEPRRARAEAGAHSITAPALCPAPGG